MSTPFPLKPPTFDKRLERVAWMLDDYREMLEQTCGPEGPESAANALITEARELAAFIRGGLPK